MSSGEIVLSMVNVSKRFGATHALRDVNLEACAGEVLALIGENGAGKSTLMKVLSGAHVADDGQMTLLGHPYAPRGPQQARSAGVAMIYQELNLAPHLSVEDNILLGREQSRCGLLDRRAGREIARHALGRLGHGHLDLQTPVENLSVGMKQIVDGLTRLGLEHIPSFGNFVSFKIKDAASIYWRLLELGVIVRPIANYAMPDYLRVSIGLETENEKFLSALQQALGEKQ